jgi:hypothetical protein
MLPQKHPFLERRQDLVVKAQLPRPRVEGNPPFKAGEEVQISLSEPPTTENNIGSNSTPATPFTWSLDDSSASLTEEGILKRSAVLTLPNADTKTEGRVIISFNEERVGQISFKRVGKDWSVEAEPQPSSRYYVREGLQMSSRRLSLLLATLAALLAYLAIARCAYSFCVKTTAEQPPVNKTVSRVPARLRALQWLRSRRWGLYLKCINPVVVTAGPYGKASLSKLQLLWFTLLVMSVLVYLLSLTGDLSDLPSSVLMLLGISAAGTVGSSLSVNTRRRLSFVNWQWLNDQEWLVECQKYGGKDAKKKQADTYGNQSRWRDLLLDEEGGVNVYKFQLLFSSVLVGIFLLLSGGSNLRGFRLPENFPQLLGITNFFYVFGRSVEPTGFADLDKAITQLIETEKKLKSSSSNLSEHQKDLDNYLLIARKAAGMTKVAFSDLAKTKFEDTPSPIPDKDLLPPWALKGWADAQLPSQPATPPP